LEIAKGEAGAGAVVRNTLSTSKVRRQGRAAADEPTPIMMSAARSALVAAI
jgi:hypothetical protein